jgi:hypothetical protein
MEKLLKQLIDRIDMLIKLQVLTALSGMNQTEKILSFYGMNVSSKDIADVLGIPITTVSGVISKKTKKKKIKVVRN